ncbi:MAG: hypothetical protein WCT20_00340 [Candidatus Babeliales bacterium]
MKSGRLEVGAVDFGLTPNTELDLGSRLAAAAKDFDVVLDKGVDERLTVLAPTPAAGSARIVPSLFWSEYLLPTAMVVSLVDNCLTNSGFLAVPMTHPPPPSIISIAVNTTFILQPVFITNFLHLKLLTFTTLTCIIKKARA